MMQCFAPKTLNYRCTTDFVMMMCLYASRELHDNPITSLHSGAFSSLPLLDELYVSAMCMLGARSLEFFQCEACNAWKIWPCTGRGDGIERTKLDVGQEPARLYIDRKCHADLFADLLFFLLVYMLMVVYLQIYLQHQYYIDFPRHLQLAA